MSWLLDVNLLLASRWTTHPHHQRALRWLASLEVFYASAITELGFLRVSLSSAYAATWKAARESLRKLQARHSYRFLPDDVQATESPETNSKDTTDAHLVALARRHGLALATLDAAMMAKPWAATVAVNPLPFPP